MGPSVPFRPYGVELPPIEDVRGILYCCFGEGVIEGISHLTETHSIQGTHESLSTEQSILRIERTKLEDIIYRWLLSLAGQR